MTDKALLRTGIIGAAVTAVCCFTPRLVVAFGALGLSALLAWLDHVLFSALAVFLAMATLALLRRGRGA